MNQASAIHVYKSVILWVIASFLLVACGSDDVCDQTQDYVLSRSGGELVIPEGLDQPDVTHRKQIPDLSSSRRERSNPCSAGPPEMQVTEPVETAQIPAQVNAPPTNAAPLVIAPGFRSESVEDSLQAWMEAWSSANAPAYLSFYASDFVSADATQGRDSWMRRRQELINGTGPANISIREVMIEDLAGGRKLVRLIQDFSNSETSQSVVKILGLRREDNGWKIFSERVVEVL